MKLKISAFLVVFAIGLSTVKADGEKGIQFEKLPFKGLLDKAKAEKKLIFIDAYTTWCGPCKYMAREIFTKDSVGDFFNARFINAKIDMEKGEGVDLATKYEVNAYPTLLFIDAEGKMVHRSTGSRSAADLIALGEQALTPEKTLSFMQDKFNKGDRSQAFLSTYLRTIHDAGINSVDARYFYFKNLTDDQLQEKENWQLITEMVYSSSEEVFKRVFKNRVAFRNVFSKSEVDGFIDQVFFNDLYDAARKDKKSGGNSVGEKKSEIRKSGYEHGDRVVLSYEMSYALQGKNWSSYAKAAVDLFNKYPPEDAMEYNNVAYRFYERVSDPKYLKTAEGWSRLALDAFPNDANVMDTYASILYKNKKYKEAEKWANRAIERGESDQKDMDDTKKLLGKIKEAMAPPKPKYKYLD